MKNFCVIGDPILHSLSPKLHHMIYSALNIKAKFQKINVLKNELKNFMKSNNYDGINITIPHKKLIVPYLDGLGKDAKSIGVVNCVMDNYGYNTDWIGFTKAMDFNGVILKGKHCLILGSGGAASAVAYALMVAKVGSISIKSRNKNQSNYMTEWIQSHFSDNRVSSPPDIVINCTPVGMYPYVDSVPIEMSFINEKMILVDTIYNPIKTKWLLDGRKLGAQVVGGLDMFIAQGILSAEIWFGIDIFNRINLSKIREEIKEEIC